MAGKSLNEANIIGNLGNDPVIRYTDDGKAMGSMSVATSQQWFDKDRKRQERTQWHRIRLYDSLAKIAEEHLKKGDRVFCQGRIEHREYEKDGEKKWITEIICRQMIMLGGSGDDSGRPADASGQSGAPTDTVGDDGLPF